MEQEYMKALMIWCEVRDQLGMNKYVKRTLDKQMRRIFIEFELDKNNSGLQHGPSSLQAYVKKKKKCFSDHAETQDESHHLPVRK